MQSAGKRDFPDSEYVNSLSFFMDTKIILKSIKEVLFRKGISSESSVTMEEFVG